MQDVRTFWNQRYAEPGLAYGEQPNDFLRAHEATIPRDGAVLCLAEGEGRNAVFLAERGHRVTALDLSDVGLAKARASAAARHVTLATDVRDLADYAIEPDRWSAIVCIWMHLPAPLFSRVIADCVRGLAPGGVLLLESYTPAQIALGTGGPRDPSMLCHPETLRGQLDALSLERFEELERDVHEGPYHQGPSRVIQVVARRRA